MNHHKIAALFFNLALAFGIAFAALPAQATVPQTLNYQGQLANAAGVPVNATVSMVFKLYDVGTGGTALWSETQSVTVSNGLYSVTLGQPATPLTPGLFGAPLYLGITVGADQEMSPRIALSSSATALRAAVAEGVTSPLKLGTDSSACDAALAGSVRWNAGSLVIEACDGTAWKQLATVASNTYSLNVARSGAGTVTSSPPGIYCGLSCAASYPDGATVTLVAAPETGSTFTGWSGGACSGTGTCMLTMSAAKNVNATFANPLAVQKTGTGIGSVVSTPAGINCGATCLSVFANGTVVTLSASPNAYSSFAGWSGACAGTGSCAVTMDGAKSVAATFSNNTYALSVSKAGSGAGTVSSSPSGIQCGATCTAIFDSGMTVTLIATPDAASVFTGWSGACTGSTATCMVTLDAAKSVMATFSQIMDVLSVSNAGAGTVASSPAGIYCGVACAASLVRGTVVTLTATPEVTATFTGWSGACTGSSATCTVTMNAAKSVTARFVYALSVNTAGTGGGMVTSSPAGISCGAICAASFDAGMFVTLTATPDATSTFTGWSGACTGSSATCTVTMDAAKSVTATFF